MKLVPLFPLEIVVFPFESLNLHIFESRYRELIKDCEANKMLFGIPCFRQNKPLKFGTLVELVMVAKTYDDGRMDVKTRGIKPFEIKNLLKKYPNKSYPGGYIEDLFWEDKSNEVLRSSIRDKVDELYRFMKINKRPVRIDEDFITFEIAHKVGFNSEQEYKFLQINTEIERQKYMLQHLRKMIPMIKEAEEMRRKVQLNGHFKNLQPPSIQ